MRVVVFSSAMSRSSTRSAAVTFSSTPSTVPGRVSAVMIWRNGVVLARGAAWDGAVELEVELTDGAPPLGPGTRVRALAYTALVGDGGTDVVGQRVILTAAALARGLGTGGLAMVVAFPDSLPADPPPAPGHIVKARYTPTQYLTLGVDEQESPHHRILATAEHLGGMPVVVADLHSAVPAILAGCLLYTSPSP